MNEICVLPFAVSVALAVALIADLVLLWQSYDKLERCGRVLTVVQDSHEGLVKKIERERKQFISDSMEHLAIAMKHVAANQELRAEVIRLQRLNEKNM